eukprot:GHVS01015832.1.p1 GENE.GHVS01015832.1~~GHVS01015832.1.p1  ORF type:complete len:217 (+),score=2.60 GHVS01015832.1:284-934(+)
MTGLFLRFLVIALGLAVITVNARLLKGAAHSLDPASSFDGPDDPTDGMERQIIPHALVEPMNENPAAMAEVDAQWDVAKTGVSFLGARASKLDGRLARAFRALARKMGRPFRPPRRRIGTAFRSRRRKVNCHHERFVWLISPRTYICIYRVCIVHIHAHKTYVNKQPCGPTFVTEGDEEGREVNCLHGRLTSTHTHIYINIYIEATLCTYTHTKHM